MKKFLSWAVLLSVVFFIGSCGKDDPAPVQPIVGTWVRANYKFTNLPTGFSKFEGYTTPSFGETNYTLKVNSDASYSRQYTTFDNAGNTVNLNDKGKWTLDGTDFKLAADNANDLDLIDQLYFPGAEFTVVGDISDIRLQMSRVLTLGLASDADINKDGGAANVPDSLLQAVDVTVIYTFNKLN